MDDSTIAELGTTLCEISPLWSQLKAQIFAAWLCLASVKALGHVSKARHSNRKDQFYKSRNVNVPYPTMLHSEQKCAHFCSKWRIVGYGRSAFWDLWIRSIWQAGHGPFLSIASVRLRTVTVTEPKIKDISHVTWQPGNDLLLFRMKLPSRNMRK